MRRLFGKASPAGGTANGRVIHDYFHHKAHAQGYTLSHSQQRVIDCMAQHATTLLGSSAKTLPGLYLHGAVGRGKSWLLDGFFRAIPLAEKQRLHFHQFFAQLHQGMFSHRDQPDALATTLDELLIDCRVLCFDEFHVHDIGDAMLITRLFKALFQPRHPVAGHLQLSARGLAAQPAVPCALQTGDRPDQCAHAGDGGRRPPRLSKPGANPCASTVHPGPLRLAGELAQRQALNLPGHNAPPISLPVGTRHLRARLCEGRGIGFTFTELCDQPTAVMDYLELCRQFDRWIIDELPLLGDCTIAAQQRFINLIDVLYDQDKHLTLLGQQSLRESLGGDAIDLARTRSRLGQLVEVRELV